jgi:signal recognition particle subunit SRP54
MREVRLALLEADVNFKVVKDFVARVRERAIGAEVLESLNAGQQVVKIVNDELTALLGAGDRTFHLSGNRRRRARRPPGLGQDDDRRQARPPRRQARPASPPRRRRPVPAGRRDQLRRLGRQLDIPVFRAPGHVRSVDIAAAACAARERQVRDVVILDTAGRLSIDEALMARSRDLNAPSSPSRRCSSSTR